MNYNNPFSDRTFSQGHKTLTWGTFVFGGNLFLLAVLIFAYPALIAYFFAGIILLAGIVTLTVAWKLWRFRENFFHIEQWPGDNNCINRTRGTGFRWNT
jgi:uncharacterized membrane protein HdeD (DUF308 family)